MDDLEKMKTGMWLYARKPQIREALQRCEELVFRFNSLPPSREEERNAIIRQLFGRTGAHSASTARSTAISGRRFQSGRTLRGISTSRSSTKRP